MWHIISQFAILSTSAVAIYLVSLKGEKKKWGYILGMLGQPFWVELEIRTEQYGLLALTAFYTFSWAQGIYNYWIKKDKHERTES